jgi:polygalacturonase
VPFCANAFYHCDADGHDDWVQSRSPAPVTGTTPQISDITIERVTVSGLRVALGAFLGLPEAPILGVQVHNVRVTSHDPNAHAAVPIMADNIREMRHEGLCFDFAELTTDDPALLSTTRLSEHDQKVTG